MGGRGECDGLAADGVVSSTVHSCTPFRSPASTSCTPIHSPPSLKPISTPPLLHSLAFTHPQATTTQEANPTSGYQPPAPSTDATLSLLPDAAANATHWTLSAVCTGCSQWAAGAIDPSGASPLAWAYAATPPTTPSDAASGFGIHDDKGSVPFDFSTAGVEGFEEAVAGNA